MVAVYKFPRIAEKHEERIVRQEDKERLYSMTPLSGTRKGDKENVPLHGGPT